MENERVISKDMKVEIPEITSPRTVMISTNGGIARQGSINKHNCLCSPTTHAGSFRCRLHRGPGLQRTMSIDSQACQDSQSKVNPVCSVPKSNNAVDAN